MSAACPVFGFEGWFDTRSLDESESRALWQALGAEVLEPRGLQGRYVAHGDTLRFTVSSEASQATDADRTAVETWARGRHELVAIRLGPLTDLAAVA